MRATSPSQSGILMRVFVERDRLWRHRPLYERLIEIAHGRGMRAGVVFECLQGYGFTRTMLRRNPDWEPSAGGELSVEIIGDADAVHALLADSEDMLESTIVTLEAAVSGRFTGVAP